MKIASLCCGKDCGGCKNVFPEGVNAGHKGAFIIPGPVRPGNTRRIMGNDIKPARGTV